MTWSRGERLYQRLPEIYRRRDREQGEPLRALLALAESQLEVVEDDIAGLYESWFIETCEDWAVPYLGDLLGVRVLGELPHAVAHPRTQVAQTLAYRDRKGTAAVLERVARDVVGWPARAVEMFERIAYAQDTSHVRPGQGGTFDVRRGAAALAEAESPFAPPSVFRTVDVRRIGSLRGRFNLPSLGLHLWRLRAFPVKGSPAAAVEGTGGAGFHFDPLGGDVPLFNRLAPSTGTIRQAAEADLPVPITLASLDRDLQQPVSGFYGLDRAIRVMEDGREVPASAVVARDLSAWEGGVPPFPGIPAGGVAIDPERGRLLFATPPAGMVRVDYAYGFAAAMGGGPYDRRAMLADPAAPGIDYREVSQTGTGTPLADAVAAWAAGSSTLGVIRVVDLVPDPLRQIPESEVYRDDLVIPLAAGRTLILEAADGARPVLIPGTFRVTGAGPGSGLTISGFLIDAGLAIEGSLDLRVIHSTLVPRPGRASLSFLGGGDPTELTVRISSSIVGGLQLPVEIASLEIEDSIVDAATGTGGASPLPVLVSGALPPDVQWPVPLGVRLEMTAGLGAAAPVVVRLRRAPADLEEARAVLQEALRAASGEDRFTRATVLRLGDGLLVRSGVSGEAVELSATPADPDTFADLRFAAPPAVPLHGLLSGRLDPFPAEPQARIAVTLDGDGPHTVPLAPWVDATGAAQSLEDALHGAGSTPGFLGAQVDVLPGTAPAADRLLVRPGTAGATVAVAGLPFDTETPAALGLGPSIAAPEGTYVEGVFSGLLVPFPGFPGSALSVAFGGPARPVPFAGAAATLSEAAATLQSSLRAAAPAEPAFGQAQVLELDSRLLVIPGTAPLAALPVISGTAGDPETARELALIVPPAENVFGLVSSGPVSVPLWTKPRLRVRLGGAAQLLPLTLGRVPQNAGEAAETLQAALAAAGVAGAQVLLLTDPPPLPPAPPAPPVERLLVRALVGTSWVTVAFFDDGGDTTATELELTEPPGRALQGLLSGAIGAFPEFTMPSLEATFGRGAAARSLEIELAGYPRDLATLGTLLEDALQAAVVPPAADPGFEGARVYVLPDGTVAGRGRLLVISGEPGGEAVAFKKTEADPNTATDAGLTAALAQEARPLLSGSLTPFPPELLGVMRVTVGTLGPRQLSLGGLPGTLDRAVAMLQSGLRFYTEPAYSNGDAVRLDGRLLVLSGVLGSQVVIDDAPGGNLATNLRLTAAAGSRRLQGRLSGDLSAFPAFPRARLQVRLGSASPFQTVELVDLPATVGEAAAELQTRLRLAGGGAAFTAASVLLHGTRLLLLPGAAVDGVSVAASAVAGEAATAGDLLLLPAQSAPALASGDLSAFTGLQRPEVRATFGASSATAVLGSSLPTDLATARAALETALTGAGFTGAQVTTTLDQRLLVLSATAAAVPSAAVTAGDPYTAADLALTAAAGGAAYDVLQSAALSPFPALTAPAEVEVQLGALSGTADLGAPPASLAAARSALEAAIRAIDPAEPAFRDARVLVLGTRLLILPGVAGVTVSVQDAAGSTAATDLGLTTAAGATGRAGLLSGSLATFPSPLRIAPAVLFRLDGTPLAASNLATVPATLTDVRSLLATAFQAVAPPGVTATVEIVGGRLLLGAGSQLVTADDVVGRPATATALGLTAAAGGLQALLSGDLAAFTGLTVNPRIRVEIAGVAGTGRFTRVPLDLAAARAQLEGAIRNAGGTPTFVNAVVELFGNRLLATAGQAADPIRFDDAASGPAMATSLALSDALSFLGRTLDGLLSGTGIVLPNLSLTATFGGSTVAVTLDQVPADLALLAPALQTGLRAAAPGVPTFAQAGVFVLGDRLLVLPGQPRDPVLFTAPSPASPDLVALLRLGSGVATALVGLLSATLPDPPRLTIAPRFQVTVGTTGPAEAVLSDAPENLTEAAALLQEAIRTAVLPAVPPATSPPPLPATFTGATVEALGDRLLVTPGAPGGSVLLADLALSGSAPVAALRLGQGLATPATGLLSGDLHTFPRLSAGPRFQARLNALTLTAYLADLPADAEGYRAALEAALRTAGALHNESLPPGTDPETAFSLARVRRLGDRFLVQPGDRGGLPVTLTDGSPAALAAPLASGIALDGLLSGDLSAFSGVAATRPRVGVALGTQGTHTVELEAVPIDLEQLRTFFERALRAAHPSETYRRARVQATGGRLLITAGEPADAIAFTAADGREADLAALRLDPLSLVPAGALLTGPVQPLPARIPRLLVELGPQGPHEVVLAGYPADLGDAAALLQDALRDASTDSNFAIATVTVRGGRLHIASGSLASSGIVLTPSPADPPFLSRFRLDALSIEAADGLLSGDLSAFPQLGGRLVVDVTLGGEGPHPATLPFIPFTPEEARESLEQAVRSAHASPAFTLARVLLGQDEPLAADPGRRLVLLPGRSGPVEVAPNPASPATAPGLRLTADTGARHVDALVSGLLPPLLTLRASAPAVGVTLGSSGTFLRFDAAFLPGGSSLAAVAAVLQEGIQGGTTTPDARRLSLVLLLGPDADNPERLVVIPGEDGYAIVLAAAATDATTVSDLRLEIGSAVGSAFSAEETGPPMTLVRSTVLGRLVLRELPLASETLFTEPVRVERRHVGCVRYSYLPEGSKTPRRFRCQPDLAIAQAVREALEAQARARGLASTADLPPADAGQIEILQRARIQEALVPRHTSTRWGHPGYGQLRHDVAREIATGAEDGSEIGAFQHLHEPKRRRQLALLLEEYLRFGLDAGLFFLT